ncbi:MAG: sugar phosphate isomerase/epimerase [Bryobacterales bacterium]|nr:sugar phosphate isomerase/epimerase [Acidobacteriota bacterium]MCB9385430.1 sugar phosphate isomerase/epimerase [Bryobacterales bacterium]
MQKLDRRQFLAASAGLVAGAAALSAHEGIHSIFQGVQIGAQSYSFRDRPIEEAVAAMKQIGLGECEMWSGHMERLPGKRPSREELREWRLNVDLGKFEQVHELFHEAGVDLHAYNYSFREDFTDAEIERGFEMAKALGAKVITASGNVSVAKRVDKAAQKHKMRVGMHNHSHIRDNEFATPADFDKAMKGTKYIAINLDIGHFFGAGFDPVDFLKKRHSDIVTIHVKDKTKEDVNMPFGQGQTPIAECLHVLRDHKYRIPANIEYEYKGGDTVVEVGKCFDYLKKALA